MESTTRIIELLGAGALLIWGLQQIKLGVLSGFGASLRSWVAHGTRTRVHAAIAGLVVTLTMQSSTATAMITSSFAARRIVAPAMAQAVMLGANCGTALAAAIVSANLGWFGPILLLSGVTISLRSRTARMQGLGKALLGLALMLVALGMMSSITEPLGASDLFIRIVDGLGAAPAVAAILAALLAIAATSSLAAVLLVASIAQGASLPGPLILALVAGANIGGAIPPLLAGMREGDAARRIPAANLAIRALGGLVLIALAGPLSALIARWNPLDSLALSTHLVFNVALLVVFLPLVGTIARLAELALPSRTAGEAETRYLDDSSLATPSLALADAAREVLRMGDRIGEMLRANLQTLREENPELRDRIAHLDDDVDAALQAVKIYLARLRGQPLDEDEAQRSNEIMSYAINLEHVGDIIEHNLTKIADKKVARRVRFSEEGLRELTQFYEVTFDNLRMAQSVFLGRDVDLARQLLAAKVLVRRLEEESSARHLARIGARLPETMDTSTLHLDILRDLKRVNAHLASPAYAILEEIGALGESRVRDKEAAGEAAHTSASV